MAEAGQMHDHIGSTFSDQSIEEARIENVAVFEMDSGHLRAGAEMQATYVITGFHEVPTEMPADKASETGDENPHRC